MTDTKKPKACNCLQESEDKIFEHLRSELIKSGKLYSSDKAKSKYANTLFTFRKDLSRKPYMEFELHYTPSKKDKAPGNPKILKQAIVTSFCPFCGAKYPTTD